MIKCKEEQSNQEKYGFKEFVKLSDKELKESIDNLKGTDFLDAFCVLQWIDTTRKENEALKQTHDYDLKMIDEVKGNSSKVLKENRQLKEQLDQATKSTINSHRYASNTEDRLIELEEQLKQRDEVIDEAIKKTKVVKEHKFDLIGRQEILETLQKYKGDNNE